MIKLKNILNEHYWNERKFGEPLPKLRINEQAGVFKNKDADKYSNGMQKRKKKDSRRQR